MENTIKNIIKWFEKYNNSEIRITSESKEFFIKININALPHLLGLQYAYGDPTNIRGKNILRQFEKEKYSDIDILKNVEKNNPEKLDNIKDRIKYFKNFMENLEQSNIVEMTNTKTRLKSNYLMIQIDDITIIELGIKNIGYEDVFETFIIEKDDLYFKDTTINEQVISIEKYNENGELEPFSFKDNIIEKENKTNDLQYKNFTSLNEVISGYVSSYERFFKDNDQIIDDELISIGLQYKCNT